MRSGIAGACRVPGHVSHHGEELKDEGFDAAARLCERMKRVHGPFESPDPYCYGIDRSGNRPESGLLLSSPRCRGDHHRGLYLWPPHR